MDFPVSPAYLDSPSFIRFSEDVPSTPPTIWTPRLLGTEEYWRVQQHLALRLCN